MANFEGSKLIICVTIFALNVALAMTEQTVPALFLFGDSLLDAGTNNYVPNSTVLANFAPYGETYFHRPTGRFTNGRTVGDFIAQALNLPLIKPYLEPGANHKHGANFASAGSGLLDSTSYGKGVIPMKQQISQFQQLIAQINSEISHANYISNSIFLISTGSNDMGDYLENSTMQQTLTVSKFIKSLMEAYEESILALYKAGAKKIIVVESSVIGCSPSARLSASRLNQTGCLNAGNQLALVFNAALGNLVTNLTATLQDAKILYAKTYQPFTDLIYHGEQYGFESTINACCGAGSFHAAIKCGKVNSTTCKFPSQSLFWDHKHPTEGVNRLISKMFWRGNTSFIEPFNIHTLAFSASYMKPVNVHLQLIRSISASNPL